MIVQPFVGQHETEKDNSKRRAARQLVLPLRRWKSLDIAEQCRPEGLLSRRQLGSSLIFIVDWQT